MSRLTAAQVIALGEYLDPDFDPASLTVSQLLGVFGYHNIPFPQPYTKPKLVQLFNDQIKANATKLKKQRIKKENSLASDEGITDGVTGKPLSQPKAPLTRRSSRRLSRAPEYEEYTEPLKPEPPKRRRSSAQPTLGGPSTTRRTLIQPSLAEESEPEASPLPKVRRSKKSTADAGTEARRRVSDAFPEDSGWEDNNVFQSGAESSPSRPSPKAKAPRKSVVPRKSRKSSSAPPQIPSSPTKSSPSRSPAKDRFQHESKFDPDLPEDIFADSKRTSDGTSAPSRPLLAVPSIVKEEDETVADELPDSEPIPAPIATKSEDSEPSSSVVSQVANQGAVIRRPAPPRQSGSSSWFIRTVLVGLALLASGGLVADYKGQSASIGFCESGKDTNQALETLKIKWEAIEKCNRENSTVLTLPITPNEATDIAEVVEPVACPPLPIIPRPAHCTPCPPHASCTQDTVICDTGFLLRPHWALSFLPPPPRTISPHAPADTTSDAVWKVIHEVTDGLPGLGPVAFPPRCVPDPKRKRNIGALGKAVEAILKQERGLRVCSGALDRVQVSPEDGGEAKKWGLDVESLRETMKKKTAPHLLETFDDTFNEAISQLVVWGNVLTGEDQNGRSYLAHEIPDLTWNCMLTVKARETWQEWRSSVLGFLLLVIAAFSEKSRRARRKIEDERVAELVQIALDTLRNQELAHHVDPVTAPQPYLSSLQLRDLVLQDEHSVSARARLWDRVEQVVESNANVRANLEEVAGGDELRVWRWMGGAAATPGGGRRKLEQATSPGET
ncbi:hypothetical protein PUNSTDRAFT_70746 [Punctularia strigosozonata HHB-11173 SS5]|uniref:uncharacterized protein n=1 Tax=Punctularia strigosozonata (strain HHB-11173) TaxID=741275 RepID=UPI0004416A34|nr:uncharacterized protein PUNSTDRAFT_70746 [Punctularia strigosozonata HHB-11173 SS5]EIN07405.1 hypothetical protein PUNSTDRAFT_70746 [Punctularia strigosozonata HHB-11173 SS5]